MASSNLLSSEVARRNHKPSAYDEDIQGTIPMQKKCKIQTEWEMVLYQSSQALYRNQPFSMALEEMGRYVSNPSSLVTSLSSSREESPEQDNLANAVWNNVFNSV